MLRSFLPPFLWVWDGRKEERKASSAAAEEEKKSKARGSRRMDGKRQTDRIRKAGRKESDGNKATQLSNSLKQ